MREPLPSGHEARKPEVDNSTSLPSILLSSCKCSGTAHRKSPRTNIVVERVHVAVAIEVQVACVAGTGCVRRGTPRVPVAADVVQLSGRNAVRIRTAQSRRGKHKVTACYTTRRGRIQKTEEPCGELRFFNTGMHPGLASPIAIPVGY